MEGNADRGGMSTVYAGLQFPHNVLECIVRPRPIFEESLYIFLVQPSEKVMLFGIMGDSIKDSPQTFHVMGTLYRAPVIPRGVGLGRSILKIPVWDTFNI